MKVIHSPEPSQFFHSLSHIYMMSIFPLHECCVHVYIDAPPFQILIAFSFTYLSPCIYTWRAASCAPIGNQYIKIRIVRVACELINMLTVWSGNQEVDIKFLKYKKSRECVYNVSHIWWFIVIFFFFFFLLYFAGTMVMSRAIFFCFVCVVCTSFYVSRLLWLSTMDTFPVCILPVFLRWCMYLYTQTNIRQKNTNE